MYMEEDTEPGTGGGGLSLLLTRLLTRLKRTSRRSAQLWYASALLVPGELTMSVKSLL